ncbi:hypothetical protein [Conexibacter sp. SYSU D00693]|uniref:PspA-associated protein PspAA n=1 Tax=Conexibacter sp. SYSU D00693 TaxID=2812560 RepID=UPI00196B11C5|nr:hypothetical protein [Conexibacter sp. SYSU D00693]
MIVRIAGEGQFDLADEHHGRLDELDDAVVAAVESGDRAGFQERFDALLQFVRSTATPHDAEDLHPSDVILPPADLTFDEAGADFSGEGLVPDPPEGAAA